MKESLNKIYFYFKNIFKNNFLPHATSHLLYVQLLLLLLLSSCTVQEIPKLKIFSTTEKQFIVTSPSTLPYSIIVEIIQITDVDLYKRISDMPCSEYFQNREMLLDDPDIKAWNIHVPPNFQGKFQLSGYVKKSQGAILFALYHKDLGNNKVLLKKKADLTRVELGTQAIASAYSSSLSKDKNNFRIIKNLN